MKNGIIIALIVIFGLLFIFTCVQVHEHNMEKIKEPSLNCTSRKPLIYSDINPDTKEVIQTNSIISICKLD